MSQETSLNFSEALNLLDSYTKQVFVNKVWIPSIRDFISIKEISANQQKQLLSSAIDSTTDSYKPYFTKSFCKILTENCQCPAETLDNFSYYDRLCIAVSMRKHISNTLKIQDAENSEESQIVELEEIVNNFKNYTHPRSETLVIEKNGVKIQVLIQIPTIKTEMEYYDNLPSYKKGTENELLKAAITDAYISEISKYIKQILIGETDLGFISLGIKQRSLVLEKLPSVIIQSVLTKITDWKKEFDEFITINLSNGNKKTLDIDANLFLST